jgi:hypothetical protein
MSLSGVQHYDFQAFFMGMKQYPQFFRLIPRLIALPHPFVTVVPVALERFYFKKGIIYLLIFQNSLENSLLLSGIPPLHMSRSFVRTGAEIRILRELFTKNGGNFPKIASTGLLIFTNSFIMGSQY